jgi:hypothetical protein
VHRHGDAAGLDFAPVAAPKPVSADLLMSFQSRVATKSV